MFGEYDHTDKVGLLVSVKRRDKNTLLPIIEQYIHSNTKIHSELWRANGGKRALP